MNHPVLMTTTMKPQTVAYPRKYKGVGIKVYTHKIAKIWLSNWCRIRC